MNHSIAIHGHRPTEHAHQLRVFAVGILCLVLAVLSFEVMSRSVAGLRAAASEKSAVAEASVTYPARELPREWRYEPQGVRYHHMYRQEPAPQRLDWIRGR
jgi:hypothetical protein